MDAVEIIMSSESPKHIHKHISIGIAIILSILLYFIIGYSNKKENDI